MPGPPPKADGQRRRRNARVAEIELPSEGRKGTAPTWPLLGRAPRRWAELWKLPEAVVWGRAEELIVARYVKTSMAVEKMLSVAMATGKTPQGLSSMQSEIRQIEDRLILTPMAKKRFGARVVTDEVAEKRDENAEAKAPTPERRRLRAVDPGAVAGT